MRRFSIAYVTTALVLAACYKYVPVESPAPRRFVRVTLTGEGTSDLARYLGPRVVQLDGDVVQASADSGLRLAVSMVQTSDGAQQPWQGEGTVRLPPSAIAIVSERIVSRRRTAVFAGGVVLALVLITTRAFGLAGGGGEGGNGGGGTPPASVAR